MIPWQALQDAGTEAEVLRELAEFVAYIEDCNINAELPIRFARLSAESAQEVEAWARRLTQARAEHHPLTVAGQYWMNEIRKMFDAALRRLEEIRQPVASTGHAD